MKLRPTSGKRVHQRVRHHLLNGRSLVFERRDAAGDDERFRSGGVEREVDGEPLTFRDRHARVDDRGKALEVGLNLVGPRHARSVNT